MTDGAGSPAVRIYTKRWCGFCFAAKRLFANLGIPFEEVPVDRDPVSYTHLTLPTILLV